MSDDVTLAAVLRQVLAATDAGLSEHQTRSALRELLLQVPATPAADLRRQRDDEIRAYVRTWCAEVPSDRKKAAQLRRDLAIYEATSGRIQLQSSLPPDDLDQRRRALFWILKCGMKVPRSHAAIARILSNSKRMPVSSST